MRAPHSVGRVVENQMREVCGSTCIQGGTNPPVVGPPDERVFQVRPPSRERTTFSGPIRVFCGGAEVLVLSGAKNRLPAFPLPTDADSEVRPTAVRHGIGGLSGCRASRGPPAPCAPAGPGGGAARPPPPPR